VLLLPTSVLAQSGGGGGGSAGGASAGVSSAGGASGAATGAAPSAGSAGAGTAAVSGVPDRAMSGGLNNSGNDPSGAGNVAKASNTPGTNSAGAANSSTSTRWGGPIGIDNGRNGGKLCRRSHGRPHRRHRHPRTHDARRRHHTGGIFARLRGGSKGQKHLQRMLRSRKTRDQRMKSFVVFVSDVEGP
jgi:hypothetical protein